MACREAYTEGSETTNSGTDPDKNRGRHKAGTAYGGYLKWISEHIFTTSLANKLQVVDAAGIGRRNMLLPGEISVLRVGIREVSRGHSSW